MPAHGADTLSCGASGYGTLHYTQGWQWLACLLRTRQLSPIIDTHIRTRASATLLTISCAQGTFRGSKVRS